MLAGCSLIIWALGKRGYGNICGLQDGSLDGAKGRLFRGCWVSCGSLSVVIVGGTERKLPAPPKNRRRRPLRYSKHRSYEWSKYGQEVVISSSRSRVSYSRDNLRHWTLPIVDYVMVDVMDYRIGCVVVGSRRAKRNPVRKRIELTGM